MYITIASTKGANAFTIFSGNVSKGTILTSQKLGKNPTENSIFIFRPTNGQYYQIINSNSGMALEMYAGTKGANIYQAQISDSPKQRFEYIIDEDGVERLKDPISGLYVTLAANKLVGGKMILWSKLVSGEQKFKMVMSK